MKMIKCDGCDAVEDFKDNKFPPCVSEVSISITNGPIENNNATHLRYDLCSYCESKLRKFARPSLWVREKLEKLPLTKGSES